MAVSDSPTDSMPFKHLAERRHKLAKQQFQIRNWAQYEAGLRRRGSLTLWVTAEALAQWAAPRRTTPGGQAQYADQTIEMCLMLRTAFRLPLGDCRSFVVS
jgi:hypothetical protein